MNSTGNGLRILTERNPYFSSTPQLVMFKLDAETLRFTEVHGSPEALIGFAGPRWLEDDFWPARVHPDDRAEVLEFCVECMQQRKDHELEYRVVRADGSVIWIHEIIEFDTSSPDPDTASGYIMNITNRVAMESDVRQVLGMKEELFRVVLEDLGNPMNKISNYGEMLERHLSSQRDDVGSDFAIGLREGLQELGGLIAALRTAGREGEVDFETLSRTIASFRDKASNR